MSPPYDPLAATESHETTETDHRHPTNPNGDDMTDNPDIEAAIVAKAIDNTLTTLSDALGLPKPTVDAKAWADLALMRLRVTAWARDCVTRGDLTPAGEHALLRILGQQTPTTPNPDSIPAGEADAPTGGGADSQQQEDM